MEELSPGTRVATRWNASGTVEATKKKPYEAFPESQRIVLVKMDTGERHDLLRDGLKVLDKEAVTDPPDHEKELCKHDPDTCLCPCVRCETGTCSNQ